LLTKPSTNHPAYLPGLTLFGHDARNRKRNPHKPTAVEKAMVCSGADFAPNDQQGEGDVFIGHDLLHRAVINIARKLRRAFISRLIAA
jgi:hypothetical protein